MLAYYFCLHVISARYFIRSLLSRFLMHLLICEKITPTQSLPAASLYYIGDIYSSADPKIQRAWVKLLLVVYFNTKNPRGALNAFDKELNYSLELAEKTVWEW
jgi:hypothetical protein